MKKLFGLVAVSLMVTACSKSGDSGDGNVPGQIPNGNQIPGTSITDGLDNSLGNPMGSIRGIPVVNRVFSLSDNRAGDFEHEMDVRFIFDGQGLLSVVATVDTEAFGSSRVAIDPLAPAPTAPQTQTFVARNVPYTYVVRGVNGRNGSSRGPRSIIRIQPPIATSGAPSLALAQPPGANPNWSIQPPQQSMTQAIQISTSTTRRSSGGSNRRGQYSRELIGGMYHVGEFDLMDGIRSDETVTIRKGAVSSNLTFLTDRSSGPIGFVQAALVQNNTNPTVIDRQSNFQNRNLKQSPIQVEQLPDPMDAELDAQ